MGASMAYAVARALATEGHPPIHLFVSGQAAPHLPRPTPPRHELPGAAFTAMLAGLGGTPPEVLGDAELMAVFEPLLRADFAVADTYVSQPDPALDVPLTALGGRDDPEAGLEALDAWRPYSRRFRVQRLSGSHFYLRENPAPLLQLIVAELGFGSGESG